MPFTRCKYVNLDMSQTTYSANLAYEECDFLEHRYARIIWICWTGSLYGAGDTKAGTLIATDKFGNKYFENIEDELPCMDIPSSSLSVHTLMELQCGQDGWTTRKSNSRREQFITQELTATL